MSNKCNSKCFEEMTLDIKKEADTFTKLLEEMGSCPIGFPLLGISYRPMWCCGRNFIEV